VVDLRRALDGLPKLDIQSQLSLAEVMQHCVGGVVRAAFSAHGIFT
jgi:hypothetical protein